MGFKTDDSNRGFKTTLFKFNQRKIDENIVAESFINIYKHMTAKSKRLNVY